MPRLSILLPVCLLWVFATMALAETSVRMSGDFRVQGTFFQNQNFTPWNTTGTQAQDTMTFWQRVRVQTDFIANENLAFRLAVRVENQTWGTNYLTAANPTVALEPYEAYLKFKVPDTKITVTIGYQPFSLPFSEAFYDSVVLAADSNNDYASLIVSAPLIDDRLTATLGYARLVDTNRTYDTTTTQVGDEFDLFFATTAVTLPKLSFTPWGAVGVIGRNADLSAGGISNFLTAGGSYLAPTGYADNQIAAMWTGATLTADTLDPIKVYADVAYGNAAFADRSRCRRHGWFTDLGLEYTGFTWGAPQLLGWWSTGEDASLTNGSERLPSITPDWGANGAFLFNGTQNLTNASLNTTPQGSMGLDVVFNNINFSAIPKLTTILAFTYATGTSSPAGLRKAVAASGGSGQYVTMGQDLALGEKLYSIGLEHDYALTDALNVVVEGGYAHPEGLHESIWGRRMVRAAGDAWQAALGIIYTF